MDKTVRIILEAQDKSSGVLGALGSKLQGMGLISKDFADKLNGLGDSSVSTGEKLKTVGQVASIAVAAGFAVMAEKSVKAAANFQQMTSTLVTTAGESEKQIGKVRDGILNLSTQTGTSAEKMSDAMYKIESAGYHGADGLKILKAAAQGAKTENADLAKVADAVTSAMRDYNLPVKDAANVTSKMVAAVGAGKTTFEEFTGSLHSVLPVASALHVPLNDILGDLASMTVHGMSADQATQNLAHALLKMQSPTQGMTSELAQMGITSSDLSDKLSKKGLSGTLEDISLAITSKLGPSGKVMLDAFNGNKIMARDAMTMMAAMPQHLQDIAEGYKKGTLSVAGYRETLKALPTDQANLVKQFVQLNDKANGFSDILKSGKNATQNYSQALQAATGDSTSMNVALMLTGENAAYTKDAVDKVGKAHAEAGDNVAGWAFIQKNFNQQMSQAKEGMHNVSIAIGTALLPPLTALMGMIVKIVTPIAEWVTKHKELATIILGSIGAFATIIASTVLFAGAITKTKAAIEDMGKAFKFLEKAGMMNPWILAIMALALIAYEVITHWKEVSKFFEKLWSDVKQWTDDAMKPLKAVWKDVKDVAKDCLQWIEDKVQDVTKFFKDHKKGLEDIAVVLAVLLGPAFVKMAIQAVAAAVRMAISAAMAGAAWVAQAARASFAWVTQELPKIIAGMAKTGAGAVISALKAGGAWIMEAARTTAAWVVTFARFAAGMAITVAQFLLSAARMAVGWLLAMGPIGLIIAIVAGIIAMIVLHWKGFSKFFVELWQDVVSFVKEHWKLILDIILGPIAIIITNWGAISRFFGRIWEDIKGIFRSLAGFVVSIFKAEWNGIVSIWNGVTGFFSGLWGGLKSGLGVIGGIFTAPFKAAFNGIADLWNNSIGKLSFKAPSWVPGIGGKGFDMPHLPHLAMGTNYFQGGMALVGENGPELAVMPQGTQVIPHAKTQSMLNGSGSAAQHHYHINVNVGAYAGQPGEIDKLGEVLWQSFQRTARRHGLADQLPNIGVRPH